MARPSKPGRAKPARKPKPQRPVVRLVKARLASPQAPREWAPRWKDGQRPKG